jgi:hypothetical protein
VAKGLVSRYAGNKILSKNFCVLRRQDRQINCHFRKHKAFFLPKYLVHLEKSHTFAAHFSEKCIDK